MMIHPLFTVCTLWPFYVFLNILDFIKAGWSIYQNVQYFIWSKNNVFNFTTVRYSLHKCSEMTLFLKRQCTVRVSGVSCALEFMKARNTFHWVVWTSVCFVQESLAIKTVSSRLPRRWWSETHFVTLLGQISRMQEKGCQTNCKNGGDGV